MDMTVEVPELPELTFDEASHIYRLNGDIIPSVSKLMEPLKDQCYGGIWSWMWRRLTEREPTWRRMPSMPFGTPSGRCRMTSTVWLEIAEWWMPSTPSTMFGGALAP